jgi:hypothetical protein
VAKGSRQHASYPENRLCAGALHSQFHLGFLLILDVLLQLGNIDGRLIPRQHSRFGCGGSCLACQFTLRVVGVKFVLAVGGRTDEYSGISPAGRFGFGFNDWI